jgi:hypothetical protein
MFPDEPKTSDSSLFPMLKALFAFLTAIVTFLIAWVKYRTAAKTTEEVVLLKNA